MTQDPALIADKLLKIMDEMDGFLSEETELLKSGQFQTVASQVPVKNDLVLRYEEMLRGLAADKEALAKLENAELKNTLLKKAAEFEKLLKRNEYALRSASISAKRVSERLTRAVLKNAEKIPPTYNARGALNRQKDKNIAAMTDGAY